MITYKIYNKASEDKFYPTIEQSKLIKVINTAKKHILIIH